jgi:hypothetical protein
MKELPMIFPTPSVQAILEGRKIMDRRVVKADLDSRGVRFTNRWEDWHGNIVKCPFGKSGDILWVRETFKVEGSMSHGQSVLGVTYKANDRWVENESKEVFNIYHRGNTGWRPSTQLPKNAARIWLQVEDIKVERLQDISEEDARAEGLKVQQTKLGESYFDYTTGYHNGLFKPRASFRTLWQSLHGPESWEANPWVWAVTFKVLSTTGKPGLLTN